MLFFISLFLYFHIFFLNDNPLFSLFLFSFFFSFVAALTSLSSAARYFVYLHKQVVYAQLFSSCTILLRLFFFSRVAFCGRLRCLLCFFLFVYFFHLPYLLAVSCVHRLSVTLFITHTHLHQQTETNRGFDLQFKRAGVFTYKYIYTPHQAQKKKKTQAQAQAWRQ